MSDTTNVMKGARSGVQKLIRNENPSVYYARCICHLADLTVKAGMQALPVKIDQLFVDNTNTIYTSSKTRQEFNDLWSSFFTSESMTILKHCTTHWLSRLCCVIATPHSMMGYCLISCNSKHCSSTLESLNKTNSSFSFFHSTTYRSI